MRKVFVEPVVLPDPRFRDGLGIRYVRTDTTDDPVEVLRPLWDVGAMQTAIRQRVGRLASFRQARFVPVRAAEVPRDDASTIEVISDFVSGHRLSQYLEASQAGAVSIETSTAIHILRELLAALALLHESRGLTHGAVGPERILITPKGRAVVADYVLGPAIERLEFTRPRLWREFRIPLPAGKGLPRLDDLADVVQVGVTALALLAGRPLEVAEYPDGLDDLVGSVGQARTSAGRSAVPAPLMGWLKRALAKDQNGRFANVRDARLALETVLSKQNAATGGATALKSLAETFGRYAAAREAAEKAEAAAQARKAALAAQAAALEALQSPIDRDEAISASTDSVPAFTLVSDQPAVSGESAVQDVVLEAVPAPVADTDPPVGWRVPEPPPAEETLPTSPLLQIDATTDAPLADEYAEEVLDLTSLTDDADLAKALDSPSAGAAQVRFEEVGPAVLPAPAATVRETAAPDAESHERAASAAASFDVLPQAAIEVVPSVLGLGREEPMEPTPIVDAALPVPESAERQEEAASVEREPEWWVLADPERAVAPTIDVRMPTETLEELVAEFAAIGYAEPGPVAPADEPVPVPESASAEVGDPASASDVPAILAGTPIALAEAPAEQTAAPAEFIETPLELTEPLAEVTGSLAEQAAAPSEPAITPPESAEAPAVPRAALSEIAEPPAVMSDAAQEVSGVPAAMAETSVPLWQEPTTKVEAPVHEREADAPSAEEAALAASAPSVLDEILSLQDARAAAQAAADLAPEPARGDSDASAWSFVEELLHHDARFEKPSAVVDEPPPTSPVEEAAAAVAFDEPPVDVSPSVAEDEIALQAASTTEPAPPTLPPDWFIEVEVSAVPEPPAPVSAPEPETFLPPPSSTASAATPEPSRPAHAEITREVELAVPRVARLAEMPAPEEDSGEPIFPRVAPSVRRVRAEARQRRVARIQSGVARGIRSLAGACASGVSAVTGAILHAISAAVGGLAAGVQAGASGVLLVAAAVSRGVVGALRGIANGGAAAITGAARACAGIAHGAASAATGAGRAALRLTRAVALASTAIVKSAFAVTARGLRVGAAALTGLAGAVSKAAFAAIKAAVRIVYGTAHALGVGLGALGRAGRSGAVAVLRGLIAATRASVKGAGAVARGAFAASAAFGRAAGRVVATTGSATAAAGRVGGRGVALAGRGLGRVAVTLPRKVYFAASDLAEHLPRPVIRPWYLGVALLLITAVAGVPLAKARWFAAKPSVGTIRVESARPDALVTIDGVPQGRVPVTATVPVGRHRIEVGNGSRTRAHDVEVAAGRETLVQAAGADLKGVGTIRVTSEPAGAEVRVDGVLHGTAPLTIEELAEGAHTIEVRDGSGSVRQTVRVKADETVDATVQIRPGWLAVFAPVRLDILENGRSIGSTERGRILASPGMHTLELVSQAMGFRETRQVEVKPGEVAAVTIQMPPASIEVVAPAEAEIFVDGQPVGTAPVGPLQVEVGTREITMRHPMLGERRQVVTVTYRTPARVVFE